MKCVSAHTATCTLYVQVLLCLHALCMNVNMFIVCSYACVCVLHDTLQHA